MKLSFCKVCAPSDCGTDKKLYHKEKQLIYGPVYLNCDRLKKNGMQQECRRTECLNNPDCKGRFFKRYSNQLVCCKDPPGI